MGTDRDQMFSGPCPCGKGTLEVDHCTKDHAFADPNQYWYEALVHCSECREKYELRKVNRFFGLFDRRIQERNQRRSHETYEHTQAILQGPAAQGHLSKFAEVLDAQASLTAMRRLLEDAGFHVPAIATFRKRWRGGHDWVQGHCLEMGKVLKAMKVEDDALMQALKKAGESDTEPDEMIGEPIYTLPKDA